MRRIFEAVRPLVDGQITSLEEQITSLEGATGWINTPPVTSLGGATGWINSPSLSFDELRGKVVAVDFCTYTCINWIRTLPYIRAWDRRYADQGLVVLGIHTPEFSVEKEVDNVRRALGQMHVRYPVAVDNDYAIWDSFTNQYWPALYLVDAEGRIRHRWFGEGDYEGSERMIRTLLVEAGAHLDDEDRPTQVDARGVEADADWDELRSPETYLGSQRAQRFGSAGGIKPGERYEYRVPERLTLNHWALSGQWTMQAERAVLKEQGGRLAMQFHARDVHLVQGPVARGVSIPFRVRLDGEPPGVAHGEDVDEDGRGVATDPRMYQLIRQPSPIVDRRFEIEFLEPGVGAFALTFG